MRSPIERNDFNVFCLGLFVLFMAIVGVPHAVVADEAIIHERVSFYALKSDATDVPGDRVHLRIKDDKICGIWNAFRPGSDQPVVGARELAHPPFWGTNQLVFRHYPRGPVRFLVADTSNDLPRLKLENQQIDGFQWNAEIIKQSQHMRGSFKDESVLMYLSVTDERGEVWWLGFNEESISKDREQFGWMLELRELTLMPTKKYRFQYEYERYPDDGGK